LDETEWAMADWSSLFVDIEGTLKPTPKHDTRMKMMWDSTFLYIAAKMNDDHIWATLKQRDTIIFQNNDFEVFIDPDGDTHDYLELEINALNTVWDLMLNRPYREDKLPKVHDEWNIENLQTAVYIEGTLNDPTDIDNFWSVEIAIPIKTIIEFTSSGNPPRHGDQWRINFSRVAWHIEVVEGRYAKKKDPTTGKVPYNPQENWVWSPSGRVNMHQPETWGYLQFSENVAGTKQDTFESKAEEKIKWGLRQLYFQQRACKKATGVYGNNMKHFTLPDIGIENYTFTVDIAADSSQFEFRTPGLENYGFWKIAEKGRVWFETD